MTIKTVTLVFLLLVGFYGSSFAQASATATATATLITPITISKTVDINFGNIAVSSTSAGTVSLTPAGTRNLTGGVALPANTGTVSAASFDVKGETGYTYSITIPSTDLIITSGSNTMTVNTFTSNPSSNGTLSGGESILTVGATLHIAAGQPSGVYFSGTPFTVTVNYN